MVFLGAILQLVRAPIHQENTDPSRLQVLECNKGERKKLPVLTGDENSVVRYKLCWIMRNKDSFNSRQRILLCVRPVKRFDIGVRRVFQS